MTFWAYGSAGTYAHLFLDNGKTACGLRHLVPQSYHIAAEEAAEDGCGCGRCKRTIAADMHEDDDE